MHIDCTALHATSWDPRIRIGEGDVEDYLEALDLDALAEGVCDLCPHVEKVLIRLTGHPLRADAFIIRTWPETHSDSDDSEDDIGHSSTGNADSTIQGLRAIIMESQKTLYGPCFYPYPQVDV